MLSALTPGHPLQTRFLPQTLPPPIFLPLIFLPIIFLPPIFLPTIFLPPMFLPLDLSALTRLGPKHRPTTQPDQIRYCNLIRFGASSRRLTSGRSVAWLARLFRVQEVVSSNLTAPTKHQQAIRSVLESRIPLGNNQDNTRGSCTANRNCPVNLTKGNKSTPTAASGSSAAAQPQPNTRGVTIALVAGMPLSRAALTEATSSPTGEDVSEIIGRTVRREKPRTTRRSAISAQIIQYYTPKAVLW